MVIFDLHLHTTKHSFDSEMPPQAMVRRAKELGLDGVVITEHDWLWTESELEELRRPAGDLVILSGMEVTTREGDFLVYGITDPFKCSRGMRAADLCKEVHRQGGAVVAAHPFRWGQKFADILKNEKLELDGLELMTSHMDDHCRLKAREVYEGLKARQKVAGLGNSDAHREEVLGICYTEFPGTIRNNSDLVRVLRSGQAVAHDREAEEALTTDKHG